MTPTQTRVPSAGLQLSPELLRQVKLHKLRDMIGEDQFAHLVASLSTEEAQALLYDWPSWAREEQLEPPGKWWNIWLILAGRGWGKSRTLSQWCRYHAENETTDRIALVAPSAADARDVIIEGESGILACCPPDNRPTYQVTKRRLVWPNGVKAYIYSAEDPDQLRGPQHGLAAMDEFAAYPYPDDVYSNLMFGLRLKPSRALITTTPRPKPRIQQLVERAGNDLLQRGGEAAIREWNKRNPNAIKDVYLTRGATYDNAPNLSEAFMAEIIKEYEGTRIGRQELMGELLIDIVGALWTPEVLDANRVDRAPRLKRTAVAIDPSASTNESANEAGIIVGGLDENREGYTLGDYTVRGSPRTWAQRAVQAYHAYDADVLIAEKNNGGQMVEDVIKGVDREVRVRLVHASKGKMTRAEPVSALDEQKRLHIVGNLPELEKELCSYDGTGASPNRLDAYVWLWTHLLVTKKNRGAVWGKRRSRMFLNKTDLRSAAS